VARHLAEPRRILEALERSEGELTDLFEQASIGLLFTTGRGRILRTNPALLSLLECRPEETVGRSLARFHSDRTVLPDLLSRLARRETLRNFQTVLRSRRGRLKEVLIDASALWQAGKLEHIRWFIRDITRRKQLEREVLAASERERRTFARELHDSLGQHLIGIAYLSNVVRHRLAEAGSPETAELARICRLLQQAIEETRRVSRGLSPVRPGPDGLATALAELAAHTRGVFGISCHLLCPQPVLVSDSEAATHLYRIAQEAVSNALRHGRARRVTIHLRQLGTRVTLRVTDNGIGISALSPRRKGLGLRVMQYRTGLLQGTLAVRPRRPTGTEVVCAARVATPSPPAA